MKPAALLWIALIVLPVAEVGLHFWTRAGVARSEDWQNAAAFVRSALQPKDLISSAPKWTDPTLRAVLGDRIDPAMAGRSDTAAYQRLWSLGIRGARPDEAQGRTPTFSKSFGAVTVERFDLAPATVALDLVERIKTAEVSVGARACPFIHTSPARGGGLGYGVLPPIDRFQCAGGGAWVADVVMEDLDITPRHCIFQPPGVGTPTRVLLRDVTLSNKLVLYGGLYYEHERMRQGAPVVVNLLANGTRIGTLAHRDGEGWKKLELPTQPGAADLAIEVSSTSRKQRGFCWAASVRSEGSR